MRRRNLILLPAENAEDGDTDTKVCIDADNAKTKLAHIMEATGHIKIQTSRRATKGTKKG